MWFGFPLKILFPCPSAAVSASVHTAPNQKMTDLPVKEKKNRSGSMRKGARYMHTAAEIVGTSKNKEVTQ